METKKILIVEDDQTTAAFLDAVLKKEGYDVVIAHNGRIALSLLDGMKPDVIICDVMMPEVNGYEFFKQVRGNSSTSEIPFLVLTAHTQIGEAFGELDIEAMLNKPINTQELLEKLRLFVSYGKKAAKFMPNPARQKKVKRLLLLIAAVTAVIFVAGAGLFMSLTAQVSTGEDSAVADPMETAP